MTFRWQFRPAETVGDGPRATGADPGPTATGPGADQSFVSQSDAESWLGENWRELAAAGVEQVTLNEGDRTLYEMSLLDE